MKASSLVRLAYCCFTRTLCFLATLLLYRKRVATRTRNHLKKTAVPAVAQSAWRSLYLNGDDHDFISLVSLDRRSFDELAVEFSARYNHHDGHRTLRGRPPVFGSDKKAILGLLLSYYTGTMEYKTLCQTFGISPSTCSRLIHRAELALMEALKGIKDARVRWPTFHQQREWAQKVYEKTPLLTGRWGFIDGKNYQVMTPSSDDEQNAMYNGWLHAHLVTGTLCFGCDGTIVWMKVNCPGSWNDGDMSREFQDKLADPRYTLDGHGVLADSAFPVSGSMHTKIMTPMKDGEWERAAPHLQAGLAIMNAVITSMRQSAEWGMGAVSKVYRRLLMRLPFNQEVRARRLYNLHHLYNYRVRRTGISQIRSYFYDD